MRSVVALSLPEQKVTALKRKASTRGFSSLSEYIRFLVDLDDELITQDDLVSYARKAEKDYKKGRLKLFESLAELE